MEQAIEHISTCNVAAIFRRSSNANDQILLTMS